MSSYQLTEPVILALLARLEDPTLLNVEIASIAAAVTPNDEAQSLTPIAAAQIFDFVPPPSFLTHFPAIGLQDMSTRLEDDTGHSATGRHTVGAVIFCSDPDQHLLAWQLRRYAQAVTRVMLAGRSLDVGSPAAAWGTGLDGVSWGPTLASTATPRTWMSWCVVSIWAKREEI